MNERTNERTNEGTNERTVVVLLELQQ